MRITANQSLILTEIEPSWKADILNTLHGAGVRCPLAPARAGYLMTILPMLCHPSLCTGWLGAASISFTSLAAAGQMRRVADAELSDAALLAQ